MRKTFFYKLVFLLAVFFFTQNILIAQSKVTVTLKGLQAGDTALLRIQKSSEGFKFKYLGGTGADLTYVFDSLSNGKWALGVDAKTYIFPTAATLDLNNSNISSTIQLNKAPVDSNFNYNWQDDSSYVGHAQQTYINDTVKIKILGKAEKVPDDFNGIKLLYKYGFLLSDSITKWTSEESYRLYQNLSKFNFPSFGEKDSVYVRAKIFITDAFIDRDISIVTINGIDVIVVSRASFTYASPLVVTVDNVKGNFFSKRLYDACVYYYTNAGLNTGRISEIAQNRFGIQFLEPGSTLAGIMNETASNFQSFTSDEKLVILSMFEEYPDAMQSQAGLKYLVRRINGQKNPTYPEAPAIAWTGIGTIEFMESAFSSQAIQYMQRLVLHEKAHFFWAFTFDATLKNDWATLGGWYLDPTSPSGWKTNNTTEFVSAYAHLKNPDEDMAETIAFYITDPNALKSRSIRKFEFLRDRVMQGSTYISIIRPDLTFQVYNLFPNYNYPGKIKRTKLEVIGNATDDKIVRFEIELTVQNKNFDGAINAQTRFTSSAGTIFDMWLGPKDATGSVLVGEVNLSKFAKSGYWRIDQITTTNLVGNQRYENNTNFGIKCFINNPLEDITPPLYIQKTLKLDSIYDKFSDFTGSLAKDRCGSCADTIQPMTGLKLSWQMIEKNTIKPYGRVLARVFFPSLDTSRGSNNAQPYSKDLQADYGEGILNDKTDSVKTAFFYSPIPDYYPSGFYAVSFIEMEDLALNTRRLFLDKDTANKNEFLSDKISQRAIRDSIHITTKYPDYLPPKLDLNNIKIKATPTNPSSPNGETLFEMWLMIKDTSSYNGHASGFSNGTYTLRDPQGKEFSFSMQKDLGNNYYSIAPDSSIYGYKSYYLKTLLPVGSAPGIWGVSSILLEDHAANKKYYSFVEIVRFDVELSKILQVTPYVEIFDKKVNLYNKDSASVRFGCKSCATQLYRLNMYSDMGGENIVLEGKMSADTITINKINLSGVVDGALYATVMMLDSTQALIGIGKASCTKDVKIPTNYSLTSNRSLIGKSNLDSFIVSIKSVELNSTSKISLVQKSISSTSGAGFKIGDSVIIQNSYKDTTTAITSVILNRFSDGAIDIKLTSVDSMGNIGNIVMTTIYKDSQSPIISFQKDSTSGTFIYTSIRSNKNIFNKPINTDFTINSGAITSIDKINNQLFKITINRNCNDTVAIKLNQSVLLDTVGNSNAVMNTTVIDKISATAPLITSTNNATSFCIGDTIQLTASSASGNAWYKDGTVFGATTSIKVFASGTYFDTLTNAIGCKAGSVKLVIVANPLPAKPIISWNGTKFSTTASGMTYQWLLNNSAVVGATSDTLKPAASGIYKIRITDQNGCKNLSDSIQYTVTAINNTSAIPPSNIAKLYPTPATTELLINFNQTPSIKLDLKLLDNMGRVVRTLSTQNKLTRLGVAQLNTGIYYLVITGKDYNQSHQIIISK